MSILMINKADFRLWHDPASQSVLRIMPKRQRNSSCKSLQEIIRALRRRFLSLLSDARIYLKGSRNGAKIFGPFRRIKKAELQRSSAPFSCPLFDLGSEFDCFPGKHIDLLLKDHVAGWIAKLKVMHSRPQFERP
jgi:hypothetical protein